MQHILRYKSLLTNLIEKDIKVVYMGAAMGFAWSFFNPIVFITTYYLVFKHLFHIDNFGLYIITGILHWNLFARVIGGSSDLLAGNVGLLKKIYFPRIILPIASLGTALIFWLSTMVVYVLLYPWIGGGLHASLLVYPLIIISYVAFMLGLGMILSITQTLYRDIKHLVDIILQVLFWFTPIIYQAKAMPEHLQILLGLNPLYHFIRAFQDVLYHGVIPNITDMALLLGMGFGTLALGYRIFQSNIDNIIDRI